MDSALHLHGLYLLDSSEPPFTELTRALVARGRAGIEDRESLCKVVLHRSLELQPARAAALYWDEPGAPARCLVSVRAAGAPADSRALLAAVLALKDACSRANEGAAMAGPVAVDAGSKSEMAEAFRRVAPPGTRSLAYWVIPAPRPASAGLLVFDPASGGDPARMTDLAMAAGPVLRACMDPLASLDESEIALFLARLAGVELWSAPPGFEPDRGLCELVGATVLRSFEVLPLESGPEDALRLAVANPFRLHDLAWVLNRKVSGCFVARAGEIRALLDAAYPREGAGDPLDLEKLVEPSADPLPAESAGDAHFPEGDPGQAVWQRFVREAGEDEDAPPVIRLVQFLLRDCYDQGASEIHIEPEERTVRVRVRVTGRIREKMILPRVALPGLTARLKIIANLDIAERRLPQNGAMHLTAAVCGREVSVRLATVPVRHGERLCLTFLRPLQAPARLEELGFTAANLERYVDLLCRPAGLILHAGTAQSGRTTAVYAALRELTAPDRVILTAEDPIQCVLPGVQQVQANAAIGLHFASLLRAFERQLPDVIFIGRLQDHETTEAALHAAVQGRLVLSTMHVATACATLNRLLDMGLDPFLIADGLIGVCAHRLVRRLCACKRPEEGGGQGRGWRPVGCEACERTGYLGWTALHEVLALNDDLRSAIGRRAREAELQSLAVSAGMRPLVDDALDKARSGLTSLAEIGGARVRPHP